ncbi:squalene synthase HpnC [Paraburkholderia bonniea]|uniref:squalene synthase HpnC n=1 Tax=Paraburkholderia bonniea TaxID=2152891 RepID=UPI0012921F0A|nr:squalene synthase HpnC [Paraburkholderia bonniea]WJF91856.1 squalene synthase HpnC [Paraburkholderia bonniea]WJF95175.1 squalene synthase HpnC [Paraburkholderia bonniea]
MEVDHYENFPVASILLPKALRAPVGVIYHVARTADDIADEGDWSPAERHARLADFRAGLDAVAAGRAAPVHAHLFGKLAGVVAQYQLPLTPFYDLVSAFDQDIDTTRYAEWPALLDYCSRSANPVGHLMLHLFDAATPANLADSDAICTALQLINFWQDVAIDWNKGRVYLPQTDLARFGVTEAQIEARRVDDAWRALMAHEVAEARALLVRGAPLALRLPGRFGLELCSVVQGGLRILERIEKADYDVFRRRPVLGGFDWCVIAVRTLAMRVSRRMGSRPPLEGGV